MIRILLLVVGSLIKHIQFDSIMNPNTDRAAKRRRVMAFVDGCSDARAEAALEKTGGDAEQACLDILCHPAVEPPPIPGPTGGKEAKGEGNDAIAAVRNAVKREFEDRGKEHPAVWAAASQGDSQWLREALAGVGERAASDGGVWSLAAAAGCGECIEALFNAAGAAAPEVLFKTTEAGLMIADG